MLTLEKGEVISSSELAEKIGVGYYKVRALIRDMEAEGKIKPAKKVGRSFLYGPQSAKRIAKAATKK